MPLLDVLTDRMDDLEDKIFGDFQPEAIQEIFRIKKQLLFLRRTVAPLRDVFNTMLRREQPIFPRETHVYFQDVFDHIIRVADTIDTLRDMLGSTMDAYLSISGQPDEPDHEAAHVDLDHAHVGDARRGHLRDELRLHAGAEVALRLRLRAASAMLVVGLGLYFYLRKVKWL